MKRPLKYSLLLLCVFTICVFSVIINKIPKETHTVFSTYASYTEEALITESELIIEGKVKSLSDGKRQTIVYDDGSKTTHFQVNVTVDVLRVLSGVLDTDEITIMMENHGYDKESRIKYEHVGGVKFSQNEHFIGFLVKPEFPRNASYYVTLGGEQGKWNIDKNGLITYYKGNTKYIYGNIQKLIQGLSC